MPKYVKSMPGPVMQSETQTRDIAVRAEAMTSAHLTDCAAYRLRLADELKTMKKDMTQDTEDIKSDISDIRLDLKNRHASLLFLPVLLLPLAAHQTL